jgi:hypothetical protein
MRNNQRPDIYLVILFAIVVAWTSADGQHVVLGQVIDENQHSMPGVSVLLKGTAVGTATDFDGNFKLPLDGEIGTIVISFVGYTTVEQAVHDGDNVKIIMKPDLVESFFNVPRLPKLFVDKSIALRKSVDQMSFPIYIAFSDSTVKSGIAIAIFKKSDSLYLIAPIDLFISSFGENIVAVGIESNGRLFSAVVIQVTPTVAENSEVKVACVPAGGRLLSSSSILFAKRSSKVYKTLDSLNSVVELQTAETNAAYSEIHLTNRHRHVINIGAPIFNEKGVHGFIVDNVGQHLVAKALPKTLILLNSAFDTTTTLIRFNEEKLTKKINYALFKPRSLSFGILVPLNFYWGHDLGFGNTKMLLGSAGTFARFSILGLRFGYQFSYNKMRSRILNDFTAFRAVENVFTEQTAYVEWAMVKHYRSFSMSLRGGLSWLKATTNLVDESGQKELIEDVIVASVDKTPRAVQLGAQLGTIFRTSLIAEERT